MVSVCDSFGASLYVPSGLVRSWYTSGICRLICCMVGDPVLAVVVTARLIEIAWNALKSQKWILYNYKEGKTMVIRGELPLVRRSAGDTKVREGGQLEVKPRY